MNDQSTSSTCLLTMHSTIPVHCRIVFTTCTQQPNTKIISKGRNDGPRTYPLCGAAEQIWISRLTLNYIMGTTPPSIGGVLRLLLEFFILPADAGIGNIIFRFVCKCDKNVTSIVLGHGLTSLILTTVYFFFPRSIRIARHNYMLVCTFL